MRKYEIDKAWFVQQLERKGRTQFDLAQFLKVDRSAVTRMLNGERRMKVAEQDRIAEYLDVPVSEVALHRREVTAGFAENSQAAYAGPARPDGAAGYSRKATEHERRHPIFGCMKGMMTIPPDLDLTAPIEVEWSEKLYNE